MVSPILWGMAVWIGMTFIVIAAEHPTYRTQPSTIQDSSDGTDAADATIFPPPTIRKTVRAVRIHEPLVMDGHLSETAWKHAPVATGFLQNEPNQGQQASFDTEVRVLFDDENLYIGAFCRDTTGYAGVRVPNLQRDFSYDDNDIFGVVVDAFRSERNCLAFQVNPYGALRDLQAFDDAFYDRDWDAIWQARTHVTDSGWTAEMVIPWATLRYPLDSNGLAAGTWGVNFLRNVRRLNQVTGWSLWPRSFTTYRMTYAGLLTGLEPPPPRTNVRVQPYAVLRSATGVQGIQWQFGGEAKWAVTPSTVLDVTVNTDFAQADVDRQVVNLRRFSVFFPERRQFFLEGASLFTVGDNFAQVQPFFSRRIGLDDAGNPLPIDVGFRLLSQSAERNVGALLVRERATENSPATTFGVARYAHNIGSGSRVGGMVTARFDEEFVKETGSQRVVTPSNLNLVGVGDWFWRVSDALQSSGMISYSRDWQPATGQVKEGFSGYAWVGYQDNQVLIGNMQSVVSPHYNPGAGFVGRQNFILTNPVFELNWRPAWKPDIVRAFSPACYPTIYHGVSDGKLQEASLYCEPVSIDFQSGANITLFVEPTWQILTQAFEPLPEMRIAAQSYQYTRWGIQANTDFSAPYSVFVSANTGGYYDGQLSTVAALFSASPVPNVAFSMNYEYNEFRGVAGQTQRSTHLLAPQLRLALNPRLQLIGFYQYNTAAERGGLNVRFSWEFEPLSFLFIVFNDNRSLPNPRFIMPFVRQEGIVKISYLRQL